MSSRTGLADKVQVGFIPSLARDPGFFVWDHETRIACAPENDIRMVAWDLAPASFPAL